MSRVMSLALVFNYYQTRRCVMIKIEIESAKLPVSQAKVLGGILLYAREDSDLYISTSSVFDGDIMIVGKNTQNPDLPSYIDVAGNITHTTPAPIQVQAKRKRRKAV